MVLLTDKQKLMKRFKIILTVFISILAITSCRDNDLLPLPIDTFNSGGAGGVYMRQVKIVSGIFNAESLNTAVFTITLEAVDGKQGASIESIDLFASFRDITPGNGTNDKTEKFVKNIKYDGTFAIDATSQLPRGTISITYNESVAALGLTPAQVDRTDQFTIRQAVKLKDVRVFSSNNASSALLTGAFYQSPYRNIVSVSCPSLVQNVEITYKTTVLDDGSGGPPSGCPAPLTGSLTLTGQDGQIKLSDASFGYYKCAFGITASGGITLNDVCRLLFFTGADQFDTMYSIDAVTVAGSKVTLDITTNYAENIIVELTKKDGTNWPTDLRN